MPASDFSRRYQSQKIRAEAAALQVRTAFLRLRTKAGFNPSQPRVPAGNSDGGQWTDPGGGSRRSGVGERIASVAGAARTTQTDGIPARVFRDRTGEASWSSYTEHRGPEGTLISRTVTNRDGSRIVSESLSGRVERNTVTLKDGSRFTFENDGDAQRIFDGKGRLVSEAVWTPDGPEPQPVAIPAFFSARASEKLLEAGASLFNWLSSLDPTGVTAVATFNATRFLNPSGEELRAEWIGHRTADEIGQICEKFGLVRNLADQAAASSPQQSYRSKAARGTDIHLKVKKEIDKYRNADFRAELSILKANEVRQAEIGGYGLKDTIRIDVFERRGDVVCVYDLKTGNRGLSAARIGEIAKNVFGVYPLTRQILVLEVRPIE